MNKHLNNWLRRLCNCCIAYIAHCAYVQKGRIFIWHIWKNSLDPDQKLKYQNELQISTIIYLTPVSVFYCTITFSSSLPVHQLILPFFKTFGGICLSCFEDWKFYLKSLWCVQQWKIVYSLLYLVGARCRSMG